MLLPFLTILIMLIVAYAYFKEGLLTSVTMFCNVILAGLIAFGFWEPLAKELEVSFANSFLEGYEDCLCLMLLFCVPLGALRWATNSLASTELDFPALLQQGGSVLFALMTGYLVAGFLLCMVQTLPWARDFLGFDYDARKAGARRVLPPDRVWLAMMHWASTHGVGMDEGTTTFDPDGSFTERYARLRRYKAVPKSE